MNQSCAATGSNISDGDNAAATAMHNNLTTTEAKSWPRLHLLGLPKELRDQIYSYAVVSKDPIDLGPGRLSGRTKCFNNIPVLTKVCRQLRHETRSIFLEQNTLKIDNMALLLGQSSRLCRAFTALCAGTEPRRLLMDSTRWIGLEGAPIVAGIDATCIITKTSDGLEADLSKVVSEYDVCTCRVERLAEAYQGQQGAIVQFLEALRQDYVDHAYNECFATCCEGDDHDECIFRQDYEWCDIHDETLLY